MIYLDTHAAVWLRDGETDWLSAKGKQALQREVDIRVSPMVVLEIQLLYVSRRIKHDVDTILAHLAAGTGLRICDLPFEMVVRKAFEITWTNDPYDRLIVANAMTSDAPLLTRDVKILKFYARAFW